MYKVAKVCTHKVLNSTSFAYSLILSTAILSPMCGTRNKGGFLAVFGLHYGISTSSSSTGPGSSWELPPA